MTKRISLKDIAETVGVSIALVSYVLNDQKTDRINKDVAKKIKDTAAALNYRTNQIAKSLKTKKTFTIGLIVSDISNPFSSGLARIIENEADMHNYTVIFGSSDENIQKFEKLVDIFINRQVDGLIIAPPEAAEKQVLNLKQQQVPFVLIDRYFPKVPASYISLDNYSSAHEAAEYLIKSGSRRPVMITYSSSLVHLQERVLGFQAALKAKKMACLKTCVKKVSIENIKSEIEKAVDDALSLDMPADAFLFGNNSIADVAVKYINRLALKVPEDLSIITFDEPVVLDLFYAPLTYIRQPMEEMGKQATCLLLEAMTNSDTLQKIKLKGELVVRESTNKVKVEGVA